MTTKERIEKDVQRLSLGTVDSKKVADLLERYYSDGLCDGQNDIVDQEKRIWEWTNGRVRRAEDLK